MFSLRDEGFSYSLDVLCGGLGARKLKFLIQKILICFSVLILVLQFLVIKTLDLDPETHWPKILEPDPH
jgi:hypothetical protein